MANEEISHAQIYDRLCAVEAKVDQLDKNTQEVVKAFNAASGAFQVLEWIAKAVKPILVIGAFFGAIWLAIDNKLHGG
jgi:wobble nucleotide-excising tRNase